MFHSAVRSICSLAGWKEPQPDESGVYVFNLEGDFVFTLSSPDGERLLAKSVLLAPEAGQEIAGEALVAVMRINAARFARMKTVTALDPSTGNLELYAFIGLRKESDGALEAFMENFLNELAFWKAQPALGDSAALAARR